MNTPPDIEFISIFAYGSTTKYKLKHKSFPEKHKVIHISP